MPKVKMPQGRPRRPSYISTNRVLDAIRTCTCGKHRRKRGNSKLIAMDNCKCIGPKSPTELHRITRLDRNALFNTLKFLAKKKVLIRNRLKKQGNHVEYAINEEYLNNPSLRREIENSVHDTRLMWKNFFKTTLKLGRTINFYNKFRRFYKKQFKLLDSKFPISHQMPIVEVMYLVKLINIHGRKNGIAQFLNEYEKFRTQASSAEIIKDLGHGVSMIIPKEDWLFKQYITWKVFGSGKALKNITKAR